MKIVAYLRTSTTEQQYGLDSQKKECEKFAESMVHDGLYFFQDNGYSGSVPYEKRPGLVSAVKMLDKSDILLVYRRDRLGRSLSDLIKVQEDVKKKKAKIVSVLGEGTGETSADKLMRAILDASSEYERDIISERITQALHLKMARGEQIGIMPFGFKKNPNGSKVPAVCQEEQLILDKIVKMRDGGVFLTEIVRELNKQQLFRRGNKWTLSAIRRLLDRVKLKPATYIIPNVEIQECDTSCQLIA